MNETQRRYYEKNSGRIKARARAWAVANPERVVARSKAQYRRTRLQIREKNLKHFYGLTLEGYNAMLSAQKGRCASCRSPFDEVEFSKRRPNVDHDHDSGRVRGLLCNACNRAAGLLGDDPTLLEALAAYLRKFKEGDGT